MFATQSPGGEEEGSMNGEVRMKVSTEDITLLRKRFGRLFPGKKSLNIEEVAIIKQALIKSEQWEDVVKEEKNVYTS